MKNNFLTLQLHRFSNNLLFYLAFIFIVAAPLNNTQASSSIIESDSLKYPRERFSVSFGGFLTTLNNDIILGSKQLGLGLSLNVEDAFGLKTSTTVLRGDVEYNFGKRRRSNGKLEYFGLYRDAQKVLDTEIEIDTVTFPVGTEINSIFNLQIFKGTYDYAFFMDDRVRLGVSIGLFIIPIRFSTKGLNYSEVKTQFTAPLPVLGISTSFAITPKLKFRQSIEFLYIRFSNFDGVLTDLNVRLEYNPWKHFGFGLGFNTHDLKINLSAESNIDLDFVGSIESSFAGLVFFGRYYF